MSRGVCDYRQLQRLRDNLKKAGEAQLFYEACAKELATRLITLATKRTPVDTGYLREQWKAGVIHKQGNAYVVEVANPVEYASYVEFGHRTVDGVGWVRGKFMLTLSEKDIQRAAPGILEKRLKKWLEGCMNGN